MRKYLFYTPFLLLICTVSIVSSCGPDSSGTRNVRDSSPSKIDSLHVLPWVYDANGDSMVYNLDRDAEQLTVEEVVGVINEKYKDLIRLDLSKKADDTVFVSIPDAQYLTHSMGSTGAFGYMAEVTYSLTEIPGVAYVHFQFEEGDHASPGLYRRGDFINKL